MRNWPLPISVLEQADPRPRTQHPPSPRSPKRLRVRLAQTPKTNPQAPVDPRRPRVRASPKDPRRPRVHGVGREGIDLQKTPSTAGRCPFRARPQKNQASGVRRKCPLRDGPLLGHSCPIWGGLDYLQFLSTWGGWGGISKETSKA